MNPLGGLFVRKIGIGNATFAHVTSKTLTPCRFLCVVCCANVALKRYYNAV